MGLHAKGSHGYIWYCGIGSMMNTVGLRARGIFPTESAWCSIDGYSKVHSAPMGMATLVAQEGSVAHGVAHQILEADLMHLETREPPTRWLVARFRAGPRSGSVVEVAVSIEAPISLSGLRITPDMVPFDAQTDYMAMPLVTQKTSGAIGRVLAVSGRFATVIAFRSPLFDTTGEVLLNEVPCGVPADVGPGRPIPAPPSARYIDTMVEGARAGGMPEKLVASIAATPCTPRVQAADCQRVPVRPEACSRFFDEAELRHGIAGGELVLWRGMVLEYSNPNMQRVGPQELRDEGIFAANQFYDPLHGLPPNDPREDWSGWAFIEHIAVTGYLKLGGATHVGWFRPIVPQAKL